MLLIKLSSNSTLNSNEILKQRGKHYFIWTFHPFWLCLSPLCPLLALFLLNDLLSEHSCILWPCFSHISTCWPIPSFKSMLETSLHMYLWPLCLIKKTVLLPPYFLQPYSTSYYTFIAFNFIISFAYFVH